LAGPMAVLSLNVGAGEFDAWTGRDCGRREDGAVETDECGREEVDTREAGGKIGSLGGSERVRDVRRGDGRTQQGRAVP